MKELEETVGLRQNAQFARTAITGFAKRLENTSEDERRCAARTLSFAVRLYGAGPERDAVALALVKVAIEDHDPAVPKYCVSAAGD